MRVSDNFKKTLFALAVWGAASYFACKDQVLGQNKPSFARDGTNVVQDTLPPAVVINTELRPVFSYGYELSQRATLENGWCLHGSYERDTVFVKYAVSPQVLDAGLHFIRMRCDTIGDYVGTGHTHDNRIPANTPCQHSLIDIQSFAAEKKSLVSLVYCGDSGISVYSKRLPK